MQWEAVHYSVKKTAGGYAGLGVCWRVGFLVCCFPPFGVSPCGCVRAGPPSSALSRVALAFMGSHVAPSGGSASDDWTKQGRTRSKARGGTRTDAPDDRSYIYIYMHAYTHTCVCVCMTCVCFGRLV